MRLSSLGFLALYPTFKCIIIKFHGIRVWAGGLGLGVRIGFDLSLRLLKHCADGENRTALAIVLIIIIFACFIRVKVLGLGFALEYPNIG